MRHRLAPTLLLAVLVGSCKEEPPAQPPPPPSAHSTFYDRFDPERTYKLFVARFHSNRQGGVQSGITITPPGEDFKRCSIEGEITEENLAALLADLGVELTKEAKPTGAIVEPIRDDVSTRPEAVLEALLAGYGKREGLRGFTIGYRQGDIRGSIDVLAIRSGGDPPGWRLVCAVHEP